MRSLTEEWVAFLESFKARRASSINTKNKKDFELALKTVAAMAAIKGIEYSRVFAEKDVDPADVLEKLEAESFFNTHNYNDLVRDYSEVLGLAKALYTERTQYDWAHLRENLRLLILRVFTAIMIALVVLGTYYVGHKAGIPLPLRIPV
jgi:hypothetical protein